MQEGCDRKGETRDAGRRWDFERREYKCADGINIQTPNGVLGKVGQEEESESDWEEREEAEEEYETSSLVQRNVIHYQP